MRLWATVRALPANFRRYLGAVGVFGIGDFAHTLLVLAATQLLVARLGVVKAAQVAGLLYVLRNTVQTLASFPVGALADWIGHKRVLVAGYALGALTAALLAAAFAWRLDSIPLLAAIFALAGLYIASAETLESAMTAELVSQEIRGIGYGVLGSVNGIGDLNSSTVVGFVWTVLSPACGFGLAALLMTAGTVAMSRLRESGFRRREGANL